MVEVTRYSFAKGKRRFFAEPLVSELPDGFRLKCELAAQSGALCQVEAVPRAKYPNGKSRWGILVEVTRFELATSTTRSVR